ncbi:hypothetical protein BBO01nite_34240 [Brevibacillus borstelensis]|jgi:hypothetical protein|nr:hypothetical protein BBO01nite_34240 [Brevibacillus borstelensis]
MYESQSEQILMLELTEGSNRVRNHCLEITGNIIGLVGLHQRARGALDPGVQEGGRGRKTGSHGE